MTENIVVPKAIYCYLCGYLEDPEDLEDGNCGSCGCDKEIHITVKVVEIND